MEAAQIDWKETQELALGKWIGFGYGRAAHVFRPMGSGVRGKIRVLMKLQYLKRGCKKKTVLEVLSRTEVDNLEAAQDWARAEAKRFGWIA